MIDDQTDLIRKIFILFVIFEFKHFIADYVLQSSYMVHGKMKSSWKFLLPLVSHTLVHGVFTLAIIVAFGSTLYWLAAIDILIHFVMDRLKAGPRYWGKYLFSERRYWLTFGLDQMVHHLTQIFIIWKLVQ